MITFPQPLEDLLNGSVFQPDIRKYPNHVGKILADNKLPYFPDYTDHGIDHINQVLAAEVDLVPPAVWQKSTKDARPRLLCDHAGSQTPVWEPRFGSSSFPNA